MTDNSVRENDLLLRYGELCSHQQAARILNVSDRTIARMLDDGRLRRLAHRIEVRSIAEYLDNPDAYNYAVRYKKKYGAEPAAPFNFYAASKNRGFKKSF